MYLHTYVPMEDFNQPVHPCKWISIDPDKRGIIQIFVLFLHENCCGTPEWDASNEYPQYMFSWRNRKTCSTFRLKNAPYLELWINLDCFHLEALVSWLATVCPAKMTRLRRCTGLPESMLDAHVRRFISQAAACTFQEKSNRIFTELWIWEVSREIFFLFLCENICCWYSLEVPQWGTSNECHNICFHGEIRKIWTLFVVVEKEM